MSTHTHTHTHTQIIPTGQETSFFFSLSTCPWESFNNSRQYPAWTPAVSDSPMQLPDPSPVLGLPPWRMTSCWREQMWGVCNYVGQAITTTTTAAETSVLPKGSHPLWALTWSITSLLSSRARWSALNGKLDVSGGGGWESVSPAPTNALSPSHPHTHSRKSFL